MAAGGRRPFATRPRRKTPYRGGAAPHLYTGATHRHTDLRAGPNPAPPHTRAAHDPPHPPQPYAAARVAIG